MPDRCPACRKLTWACVCTPRKDPVSQQAPQVPKRPTFFKLPSGRFLEFGNIIDAVPGQVHQSGVGSDRVDRLTLHVTQSTPSQNIRFCLDGEDALAALEILRSFPMFEAGRRPSPIATPSKEIVTP